MQNWLQQQWQRLRKAPLRNPAMLREDLRQRRDALQSPVQPATQGGALQEQQLIVFDLETSGLNTAKDLVLAAGAICLEHQAIVLSSSLESVWRVDVALREDSQLIHGLTQADLANGEDPGSVLLDLLEQGQNAIWLAYHAAFDHAMLKRAAHSWLGLAPEQIPQPIDVADLAPMLFPHLARPQAGLDYWLQAFRLDIPARHNAAADAFATAQIVQILLAQALQKGMENWPELLANLHAWQKAQAKQAQRHQQML